MPPLCTLTCVFARSWQVPVGLKCSGERRGGCCVLWTASSRSKNQSDGQVERPDRCSGYLCMERYGQVVGYPVGGRVLDGRVPGGWPGWSPCLACHLPVPRAATCRPTARGDSTGCARWLSGPVPGGCGDTVGVCAVVCCCRPPAGAGVWQWPGGGHCPSWAVATGGGVRCRRWRRCSSPSPMDGPWAALRSPPCRHELGGADVDAIVGNRSGEDRGRQARALDLPEAGQIPVGNQRAVVEASIQDTH